MRSRRSRILIHTDGKDLAFCHQKLKIAINDYVIRKNSEGTKITRTELRQELADHLNLSPESIKNYVQGYNGPMDIETVKRMADYLETDWIALMKEISPIAEKRMSEIEKSMERASKTYPSTGGSRSCLMSEFEKTAAWNAVREVYQAMRGFVSYFEGEFDVPVCLDDEGVDDILASYRYCWDVMHKNMLDIPKSTYDALKRFLSELRYWIYGLPEAEYDEYGIMISEPKEYDLTYFNQLNLVGVLNEEDGIDPFEWADYVTGQLIDTFYSQIGSVLMDYRPRDPYGCDEKEVK